ncbi:6-pyruvoyl tetrahydropterin synthase family protein [Salibacter sp.]|uniref:6-pyruvoyl trahydropterin synthase family protein n=1 Tax=Salibacter sp. TaxID=2010995 RepID=UPI0028700317|nr:6-pyruvoyl tetrahydropterin synthase family protein [Salibacter sp.]MDR9486794.1 6-pyruvoyl tetrahydropterin synthase family protein [Salibacter sp.]
MAKLRVTKQFDWEMAHALDGHDGKCHNIHGHTYELSVTFLGTPNDDPGNPKDGMVIDFSDLKSIVKDNIVKRFDHALVLRNNSRFLNKITEDDNERLILTDYQPTCEMMLLEYVEIIQSQLKGVQNVSLHSARLRETKTSFAEWFANDN